MPQKKMSDTIISSLSQAIQYIYKHHTNATVSLSPTAQTSTYTILVILSNCFQELKIQYTTDLRCKTGIFNTQTFTVINIRHCSTLSDTDFILGFHITNRAYKIQQLKYQSSSYV